MRSFEVVQDGRNRGDRRPLLAESDTSGTVTPGTAGGRPGPQSRSLSSDRGYPLSDRGFQYTDRGVYTGSSAKSSARALEKDIVQFTAPICYADEEDGVVKMDLMRMGPCKGKCSVRYKTVDASGKAGQRYEAASGLLEFADGQASASIEVKIIDSRTWSATLEFKVELSEPVRCELGLFLKAIRIKIIDHDIFPSNKHAAEITACIQEKNADALDRIPAISLMREYLRLLWQVEGVSRLTIMICILDQFKNVYLYFTLSVKIYLVDVLFADDPGNVQLLPGLRFSMFVPGDRGKTAAILGVVYFLPMFVIHVLDDFKVLADLEGKIDLWIGSNLMRKYLNYCEESRLKVSNSHMQLAVMEKTGKISTGFVQLLRLSRSFGKVLVVLVFAAQRSPSALPILLLMPTLMAVWAAFRLDVYVRSQTLFDDKKVLLMDFVSEFCEKYELIAEYFQRPLIGEMFEQKQHDFTNAELPKKIIYINNWYVNKMMGPFFMAVYIALEADMVLKGETTFGTFLTTVGLFNSVSNTFLKVYDMCLAVHASLLPIRTFTQYLNLPTDLTLLKKINRQRREMTKTERAKARELVASSPDLAGHAAVDYIPIKLVGLTFEYVRNRPVFVDLNAEVQQGSLVAIVSEIDEIGRSTLLKLLGQRVFPQQGQVFIPSHLRVLHVSQTPTMLDRSMWKNLIFGAPDVSLEKVKDVLTQLGMHKVIQDIELELRREAEISAGKEQEEEEGDSLPLVASVNACTMAKVHLARALIMNPEVLVLQRPLTSFDQVSHSRSDVMRAIRMHVDNRGVGMDPGTVHMRRPRTCFFTAENMDEAREADIIWHINEDAQIEVMPGHVGSDVLMAYDEVEGLRSTSPVSAGVAPYPYVRERDPGMSEREYQDAVITQNELLRDRVEELEAELVAMEGENKALQESAQSNEQRVMNFEDLNRAAVDNMRTELQKESRRLGQMMTDERKRYEDLNREVSQLRRRATEAEARVRHAQQHTDVLRRRTAEIQRARQAAEARKVALARQAADARKAADTRGSVASAKLSALSEHGSHAFSAKGPSIQMPPADTTDETQRTPENDPMRSMRACRVCVG